MNQTFPYTGYVVQPAGNVKEVIIKSHYAVSGILYPESSTGKVYLPQQVFTTQRGALEDALKRSNEIRKKLRAQLDKQEKKRTRIMDKLFNLTSQGL